MTRENNSTNDSGKIHVFRDIADSRGGLRMQQDASLLENRLGLLRSVVCLPLHGEACFYPFGCCGFIYFAFVIAVCSGIRTLGESFPGCLSQGVPMDG